MKARQSENARALLFALGSVKRVNFFLKQMLAQVDQNEKLTFFPRKTFPHINGAEDREAFARALRVDGT